MKKLFIFSSYVCLGLCAYMEVQVQDISKDSPQSPVTLG